MRAGLTIGDFAALTRLSVRTLRRYHEAGLLEPDTVDPSTGYRYYTAEQIPTAQVIYQLRQLGFSGATTSPVWPLRGPAGTTCRSP